MASVDELNENSTKEDINSYVEQMAEEVKTDRDGTESQEPKGDARITSEHADNEHKGDLSAMGSLDKETPAETGSDTAPEGEDVTKVETGDKDESWLDDDLKAEVAAYGIGEAELADFASRDELERALRLFDTSAIEAGRKALAESDGSTRDEKGQFTKKEEPKPEPPKEGRYEFKPDIYDDDLENDLKGYRDYVDARLEEVEARFAEADALAKERHFDNLVDSLGHADLFGKTDQETAKEKGRRDDLYVEVETYLAGREVLGRPSELNAAILKRIARSTFSKELGKKELKQHTRKISKQANGRQGGGATRPQDPREDPRDEFDRKFREMGGHL